MMIIINRVHQFACRLLSSSERAQKSELLVVEEKKKNRHRQQRMPFCALWPPQQKQKQQQQQHTVRSLQLVVALACELHARKDAAAACNACVFCAPVCFPPRTTNTHTRFGTYFLPYYFTVTSLVRSVGRSTIRPTNYCVSG